MALPTVASVVTSGLAAYPSIYFDTVALDTLHSNLFMYPACDLKQMPDKSGVAMQIFDHTKMAANTAIVTEGTPLSAGQAITQNVRTLSLDNYADFVSISSKAVQTNNIDTVAEGAALLSYRGALSVDTVISTAVDTASNADATSRIDVADGTYMSAALSRKAMWGLRSLDIKPKDNGLYFGIIHSLVAYDLVNDNTAGGFTDLQKYSDELAKGNAALVGIKQQRIGNVGGVEWYESNAVPTETAWQSTAHNAYHAYVFGKNAFIASSLGKTQLNQKNFSVMVKNFEMGSNSLDPAGLIKATAAYNFFFGVVKRTGSTNGFRRIRSESSIG